MQINNITVPDASTTTQYIPDPIGGWVYKITTTIVVENVKLTDYDSEVSAAQRELSTAQAKLDSLTAVQPTIDQALVNFSDSLAVQATPSIAPAPPVQ